MFDLESEISESEISESDKSYWIQTPLIDLEQSFDFSLENINELFKYFLLSSERLSQMTKVYNDIEAVIRLLEEVIMILLNRIILKIYFKFFRKKKI